MIVARKSRAILEQDTMRVETVSPWIFLGFGLLAIGSLLNLLEVAGQFAMFVAVLGSVYFGIGMVLAIVRDRQMQTRTRAGRLP